MRELYPAIEPYDHGYLAVSDLHTLYYEQVGNPNGKPAVFLHGGPGAGISEEHRRFFNPARYRIILFDQRGCGKSTPHSELRENSTWDLVSDIEKLRQHLGIERWQVFGGSWGSTLALAYSTSHPERCTELVLRGIFLVRQQEIQWFYQAGCHFIYPDYWQAYRDFIPENERYDFVAAYHKRLNSDDMAVRAEAARRWSVWEASTSKLLPDIEMMTGFAQDKFADAFARIENHYFINNCFMPTDNYLLENVDKIKDIPAVIVQGRYDVICPAISAWELAQRWGAMAELKLIADAGHSAFEKGIVSALIEATDKFAVS